MKHELATLTILLIFAMGLCACGGDEGASTKVFQFEKRTEGPLSIIVVGDTMLDDLALPYIKKYGHSYQLAGVKDLLLSADIVNANLEVAVDDQCKRSKKKKFSYFMNPKGLKAILDSGINVVCLANNHTLDCGQSGLANTLRNVDEAGLARYGAGFGEERNSGVIVKVEGTKIGFIGWYNYRPEIGNAGTAHITEENVRSGIQALKKKADIVVATFHWGKNYEQKVDDRQRRFGRLAIDSGADAVIGHHPHIPQAMTVYKDKPILYSVGNFIFSTGNNRAKEGLAARLIVKRKKLARLEVVPLFNQNRHKDIRWQTKVAKGKRARNTIKDFVNASRELGADLKTDKELAWMTF